jgi:hypothetical protein
VTYGLTKRMKDIQKVLSELNRLAKKWQLEDSPTESGTARAAASTAQSAHPN